MERLCQSVKTFIKRRKSMFSTSFTYKLEDTFLQFEVVRSIANVYLNLIYIFGQQLCI